MILSQEWSPWNYINRVYQKKFISFNQTVTDQRKKENRDETYQKDISRAWYAISHVILLIYTIILRSEITVLVLTRPLLFYRSRLHRRMLVGDVGDEICWRQLWDVGDDLAVFVLNILHLWTLNCSIGCNQHPKYVTNIDILSLSNTLIATQLVLRNRQWFLFVRIERTRHYRPQFYQQWPHTILNNLKNRRIIDTGLVNFIHAWNLFTAVSKLRQ